MQNTYGVRFIEKMINGEQVGNDEGLTKIAGFLAEGAANLPLEKVGYALQIDSIEGEYFEQVMIPAANSIKEDTIDNYKPFIIERLVFLCDTFTVVELAEMAEHGHPTIERDALGKWIAILK